MNGTIYGSLQPTDITTNLVIRFEDQIETFPFPFQGLTFGTTWQWLFAEREG
jgi:hypothetical protein